MVSYCCFQHLRPILMLPWRWVMWSSHLFSGNPLNVALQPSEWRIFFLVWNTGSITTRPLPTSPSFYAPSHQVQLLVVPGLRQVVSYLFTFAPRSPPPGMLFIPVLSADTSISFKTELKHHPWRKLSWSGLAAEVSVASTQPILHSPNPMFWGREYLSPEDVSLIYKKVLYVLAATLLHKWNLLLPFLHSHYTPYIPAVTYWTCSLVERGETEIWILGPLRAMPSLFWLVTAARSTEPGPY